MKKQLLCTSAIALGVAAAPATAQEWNLDWGGFMTAHVAVVDTGGSILSNNPAQDHDGLSTFNTGEIIFTPSITLDNGMTFGINVQMEAQNGGGGVDGIDESYLTISSDTFGTLDIGGENSAGYKLSIGAPEATSMFINSPSISAFIPVSLAVPFNFRMAGNSSYTEVAGNNDVQRISYYTPDFNGFTLGVSYAPTNRGNASNSFSGGTQINNRAAATVEDIWDIGINYSQTFGTTDVAFSARYGEGSAGAAAPAGAGDPSTWAVGLNVGFQGFTIGGSYSENDNDNGTFGLDQEGWSFGMTYEWTAWTFEALTYQGTYDVAGGNDMESEIYKIGARRNLGSGVNWDIYGVYADANNGAGGDVDGYIFGTAIALSF